MGRPYGVGFYGTHKYSTGEYAPSAAVAYAHSHAYADSVPLRDLLATAGASAVAYAYNPSIIVTSAYASGAAATVALPLREVVVVTGAVGVVTTTRPITLTGLQQDAGALLRAQASAHVGARYAWEEGESSPGPWVRQDTDPRSWRPQGERPPRPYGRGLYSAGRYSSNPPILVDRWHEV